MNFYPSYTDKSLIMRLIVDAFLLQTNFLKGIRMLVESDIVFRDRWQGLPNCEQAISSHCTNSANS